MPWVRKIVNGRERLVFVSGAVPKKTTTTPTKASQVPGYVPPKPKTTASVSVTGKTKPKAPAVPTRAAAPVGRAEPIRRAIGATPTISGRPVQTAPSPTRLASGAPSIPATASIGVFGRPRSMAEAISRGVAPYQPTTAPTTRGAPGVVPITWRAVPTAQPRPTPINTPESLGLYQGRPRLGGAEGRAIQGPSALDVFLGRQARATTTEELTGAVPRLQERLRVIGATPRQQAQGGAMAFLDGLGPGVLPDVMTDAVASYVIGPLGYGSIEELMRDLGFIPNPDAPGTWLRGEVVQPGGTGTGGGNGGGPGGGFSFIPSSIDGSRGGRSAMGLVNWRI